MRMTQLKTIADIQTGPFGSQLHKEDYVETGTPIVTVEHLGNRVFTEQNLPRVSDSDKARLIKYTLSTGDIVFSRVGSVDRCSYVDKSHDGWMFSGRCLRVRPTELVDSLYLYYYFCLEETKQFVRNIAVGATMPSINTKLLGEVEIALPDLNNQKRIAAVLSSLDDKIENNQKLNDNLYAQAKATTKQWISKSTGDYELLPLSDIASINPDTYSPKETWKYVNYLDTSSITEGCIAEIQHITPSSEKLPSRARRKIAPNDIVFSTVRPNQRHYGIISEPLPNMLGSTGFAVIRSKNPLVCNELIYLCLTENEFIEKMQQLAEQSTSTFPSIKPSDLGVCEIPCPKDQSSMSFTETLKSLFALIAANQRENISLSEIRDVLLPKLMSGEIDVSDIQL